MHENRKKMKPKVYIETSVLSYLTARLSKDLIKASNQLVTREWWDGRSDFQLFVSRPVLDEASQGDPNASRKRIESCLGIPVLESLSSAENLAQKFLEEKLVPKKALIDAAHVAIAAVHEMDYLLTWNCKHIANATLRNRIYDLCKECGYKSPVICTPSELILLEEE